MNILSVVNCNLPYLIAIMDLVSLFTDDYSGSKKLPQ
jgi:hypothetical protein